MQARSSAVALTKDKVPKDDLVRIDAMGIYYRDLNARLREAVAQRPGTCSCETASQERIAVSPSALD